MAIHPCLPWTVLVYICFLGVLIFKTSTCLLLDKHFSLDHNIYGPPLNRDFLSESGEKAVHGVGNVRTTGMNKQLCPVPHVGLQEEDSRRVHMTVEVNRGNRWCCSLRNEQRWMRAEPSWVEAHKTRKSKREVSTKGLVTEWMHFGWRRWMMWIIRGRLIQVNYRMFSVTQTPIEMKENTGTIKP